MKAFFIILTIILSLFFLTVIFFAIKSHKFLKILIFNAFLGMSVLAIIDLMSKFTGMHIPVNQYTVIGSSFFGIPSICGFLLLQILLI